MNAVADIFDFTLPTSPYPGLRPFAKDEWPVFFGRERMVDEVIERLINLRLLVVHGDSGCGKSSLIRAGVIPRLEQECARGGSRWRTCTTTPGQDPLENFAAAIAAMDDKTHSQKRRHEVLRILNGGHHGAPALVEYLCGARREHVCILLDQFEELFAHAHHHGPHQASVLIDMLIGLHQLGDARLRVILTMRSEFLGACAQYDGFAQVVNATQYLLPRMERPDLLRAIQEAATLYEGVIAQDVAERLISDARTTQDQLPLIQHALMRLHAQNPVKPGQPWRLGMEAYPSGGLRALLSDHADEVLRGIEPQLANGRHVVEEMFRALTEINADHRAVRRPQTFAQLLRVTGAGEAELRKVIDAFRAEGVSFVRPYGTEPVDVDDIIDISHEALIRCWRKIADDKDGWLTREFSDGLIWSSLLVQCKSYEKDSQNVLSAATTEERRQWLAGRNAAWAERYGGGWERVQKLITASAEARELQLKAEKKARRLKVFRWGFAITSTLLFVTVYSTISAVRDRAATNKAMAIAAVKSQLYNEEKDKALKDAQAKQLATDNFVEQLRAELASLKEAAQTAPANSALRQSIDAADLTIQQQVVQLNSATRAVQPRIYFHIANESQRIPAQVVARGLRSVRASDFAILVPGIQLVARPPGANLLRCFDAIECKEWGEKLTDLINQQLGYPQVRLQDFSGTFTDQKTIRPLHFELYFAAGDIKPALRKQKGD